MIWLEGSNVMMLLVHIRKQAHYVHVHVYYACIIATCMYVCMSLSSLWSWSAMSWQSVSCSSTELSKPPPPLLTSREEEREEGEA